MAKLRTSILVVDDSSTVCKFISSALSKADYQVTEAYDMETALSFFEVTLPDLVLTDIMMPGIGGLAGISIMRTQWPETAIVAMSAGTDSLAYQDALAAARTMGADGVIKKPFKADELYTLVKKTLAQYADKNKGKRILVIDDSSTICKLLTKKLNTSGYISNAMTSMEEALASDDVVGLDLVIIDIFMPGLGGIAGIAHIRKNWPDIKIIAISGGWETKDGDDALSAAKKIGADAAIKKPFDMALLETTIEQLLGT